MLGILYRGKNSRNSVLYHSAEERTTRNSVPWNKNRSKHLEFCSEPCRGRKNNSEFCSMEQKYCRSKLSEFRSEACLGRKHAVNSVCCTRIICRTNFFMLFPSVPSFGIDSSANLGMPRNEQFLPRNNENLSEEFFRNENPLPTLLPSPAATEI